MASYAVMGQLLDPNAPQFHRMLEKAYDRQERPLCMCRPSGVPMYIAHTGSRYVIKRMPNSGLNHSAECDRFEMPITLSGKGEVLGQAIMEDPASNTAKIKFGFALTNGHERVTPMGEGKQQPTVKAKRAKLTLRGFLDYLWDEANLTLMAPGFVGKRNWWKVRKMLLDAAVAKTSNKFAITDLLFLPEAFSVERKDEIAAARRRKLILAQEQKHRSILIGEVKAMEPSRFGGKVIVKHLHDYPIYMNDDMLRRVTKHFSKELDIWRNFEGSRLIAIATFSQTPAGFAQADEVAFMNVSENWVPFYNLLEKELIDRLVFLRRRFVKALRYNVSEKAAMAFGILTDAGTEGVAMFISPEDASNDVVAEYQRFISESPIPTWYWDARQSIPAIPASHSNLLSNTQRMSPNVAHTKEVR